MGWRPLVSSFDSPTAQSREGCEGATMRAQRAIFPSYLSGREEGSLVVVAWQRDSTDRTDEASARKKTKNAAGEAARPSLPIFPFVFPEFCFSAHSFRFRFRLVLSASCFPFIKILLLRDRIGGRRRPVLIGTPSSIAPLRQSWLERISDPSHQDSGCDASFFFFFRGFFSCCLASLTFG